MYLSSHAVPSTILHNRRQWVFDGGANSPRKLEKLCNELLCNCFVIAERIEPLPQSPQLRRNVGAKIIYRQSALKRLAGFRVKIDLFSSSFIFLFFLAPLCYIFSSLFLWLGGFFYLFFFPHLLHTPLQLHLFTTYHHDIAALREVADSSRSVFLPVCSAGFYLPPPSAIGGFASTLFPLWRSTASWGAQLLQRQSFSGTHLRRFTFSSPRSVQSWLHVSFAICLSGWYSNLDHLAERRGAAQWAVGGGGGGSEEEEDEGGGQGEESFFFMPLQRWRGLGSWTLVTHQEFATCIKSLSNRWSHKFDLNAQSIFFLLCFTLFTIWEIFWIFSFVLLIFLILFFIVSCVFLFYCLICLNIFFLDISSTKCILNNWTIIV